VTGVTLFGKMGLCPSATKKQKFDPFRCIRRGMSRSLGDMEYQELSRLENIVENLLSQFGSLRQEKEHLESELERKRLELAELREATAQLQEEKNVIHGRVNSLISSLEKWERAQAGVPQPVDVPLAAVQQDLQYAGPAEPQELTVRG
jgi:predicted nuclease with TOPRIM domain